MHRLVVAACFIIWIVSGNFAQNVIARPREGVRLECRTIERVDADHFRVGLDLINGTSSEIYVQASLPNSDRPYPVYLERQVAPDSWQTVAPCVDLVPSGAIAVNEGKSLKIDPVQSMELPSTCRTRRIDAKGKYRWRIEYFTDRNHLVRFEKTAGKSGNALSMVSKPFSLESGNPANRKGH
jgi:hypothetical protein